MTTLSTTVQGFWLGPDTHANRPATPLEGTLYVCTTHGIIEKYASGAWSDWATLGAAGDDLTLVEETTPTSPSAGDQKLFIDSTDHHLKRVNSSGTVVDIESGGGGGGSAIKDPRWNVLTGQTSVDEFNDSAIDVAWTRVDKSGGSGRATWTEDADVLSVYNPGGDTTAELHAMMHDIGTALSVGDGFVTCVHLSAPFGATLALVGLVLADGLASGSGTQATGSMYTYSGTGSSYYTECDKFTNYQVQATTGTPTNVGPMGVVYLRLAMVATNSYRLDVSPDGVSWVKGVATSITFTPAYVGVHCSSWGSSQAFVGTFEFLRRVAGVT